MTLSLPAGVTMSTTCASAVGSSLTAGSALGAKPLEPFAPSSETAISASAEPTPTVSPTAAWSLTIVPDTGVGTSASILSVEISTSVSLASIRSPSCLCHSRMVPSTTESPIAGITT